MCFESDVLVVLWLSLMLWLRLTLLNGESFSLYIPFEAAWFVRSFFLSSFVRSCVLRASSHSGLTGCSPPLDTPTIVPSSGDCGGDLAPDVFRLSSCLRIRLLGIMGEHEQSITNL